jgi:hypothetical protein
VFTAFSILLTKNISSLNYDRGLMRAIRNMEPAWLKVNGGNFSLVEYRDKKGQLRPCYSLTKTECLYIATKFNDEARCAKWIMPWGQVADISTSLFRKTGVVML